MKQSVIISLFSVLLFSVFSTAIAEENQLPVCKSLVIMIDGCRADLCCGGVTPNLDSLRLGTWADGYKGVWSFNAHAIPDTFPNSTPNHVSIATGVFATKHQVLNNGSADADNYAEYPTYLSRLEKANPDFVTAFFYNWGEDFWMVDKAKTPYDYSRTFGFNNKLDIHEVNEVNHMLRGTSIDQTGSPGEFAINQTWTTGNWKAGTDPDAILLYLEGTDPEGHGRNFSVFNDNYFSLITNYDYMIGMLLDTIKNRPNFANEDWQIVVTSDHGGINRSHGVVGCHNCYTVPLIVSYREGSRTDKATQAISSPDIQKERSCYMLGEPSNADSAAYALLHMLGEIPEELDGKIRSVVPVAAVNVAEGLILHESFDNTEVPSGMTPQGAVQFGQKDGISGGYLQFGAMPSFVSLEKTESLDFCRNNNFSIAFWIKFNDTEHTFIPVFGNKDWSNGKNPGFQISANYDKTKEKTPENSIEWSLGDGTNRMDLKQLPVVYDEWNFIGVTVDRSGNTVLFVGHQNGRLAFISADMTRLGETKTEFNWSIGQDGTGKYLSADNKESRSFPGMFDELSIWNRALSIQEMTAVFQNMLR